MCKYFYPRIFIFYINKDGEKVRKIEESTRFSSKAAAERFIRRHRPLWEHVFWYYEEREA